MKPTEYPEEDARALPFAASPEEASRRDPAEKPRYIEVPASPEQSSGQRNLAWGVVCLVLAVIGLWLGLKFDRAAALQCLVGALGAFGVSWLLYNFQVLRQRHGQFLGLGLVVLFGAVLPFLAAGVTRLDRLADERVGGNPGEVTGRTVPPPVPTAANAPAAPTAPELAPEDLAAGSPPLSTTPEGPRKNSRKESPVPKTTAAANPAATSASVADDGVVREFLAPAPNPKDGKIISIAEDCIVTIEGRKWRLKKGQTYKFKSLEDGVVTFIAGEQEVSIDSDYVKFTGQSLETPEKITQMAIVEAANRYPALRDPKSKENRLFNVSKIEMEADPGADTFFKNPRWPIILADQLADSQGWKRADLNEDPAAAAAPAEDKEAPAPPPSGGPSSGPQSSPPAPEKVVPPASPSKAPASKAPVPDLPPPASKPGSGEKTGGKAASSPKIDLPELAPPSPAADPEPAPVVPPKIP